jgi:hypothetical protein
LLAAYSQQVSLKDLCFSTDQYCQTLFNAIPDPFSKQYEKRLIAIKSNGQTVFDSNINLRIYDYKINDIQLITLIKNPLEKNSFSLYTSLASAPFWAYVDVNDPNNNEFIGSTFNFPVGGVYEFAQAYINGIGIGSRYATTTKSFNYNVSYYLGITDSYNVNDSEALIVRLGWKLK